MEYSLLKFTACLKSSGDIESPAVKADISHLSDFVWKTENRFFKTFLADLDSGSFIDQEVD
jgi:hypothetical protein